LIAKSSSRVLSVARRT